MSATFFTRTGLNRWLPGLAAFAALALTVLPASAVVITNVSVVNLTPSGFDVLWRAESSTPAIAVFADAGGVTNLVGQVGIETFPLHTGSPSLSAGYARRLGQQAIRQQTRGFGLAMVRVTGCRPGATYYYRLTSTPTSGSPAVYPASGPLPSVTTPQENTFVVNDQSLILEVPALDAEGRIVLLSHSNAPVSLAAVVGDGAGTNQVFFHLNDLFALAGGGNFGALGAQEFAVTVMGAGQSDILQKFTVNFGADFSVGQGTVFSVGTEFLAAGFGSAVVRAGQNTSVAITANTSASVSGLDFMLDIPAGHLGGFALQSLAAELDPATSSVTPQGGTTWRVRLRSRAGQSLTGDKQLALLTCTALPGQISAFVPLRVTSVAATHPDTTAVKNLFAQSGRIVVVGDEPLLEALRDATGQRYLTLYGIPGVPYAIEQTAVFTPQTGWSGLTHLVAQGLVTTVSVGNQTPANVFYRAYEFYPDPPVLDIAWRPDGSLQLTAYGRPGMACAIQYTTSLGSPWLELTHFPLTNGLAFINLPKGTQGNRFYRVVRFAPDPPVSEIALRPDGSLQLTVYGQPGTASAIQYTTSLGSPWVELTHFPLTNGLAFITLPPAAQGSRFYRTIRFAPDPPVLEALQVPGGGRALLTYGQTGLQYTVLAATNMSAPVSWTPALNYTMTNAYRYLTPPAGGPSLFYRLRRN